MLYTVDSREAMRRGGPQHLEVVIEADGAASSSLNFMKWDENGDEARK